MGTCKRIFTKEAYTYDKPVQLDQAWLATFGHNRYLGIFSSPAETAACLALYCAADKQKWQLPAKIAGKKFMPILKGVSQSGDVMGDASIACGETDNPLNSA